MGLNPIGTTKIYRMKLSYLAAPYSCPEQSIVIQRMRQLMIEDAKLTEEGYFTVSPLYKHYILDHSDTIGNDWSYWKLYSHILMKKCDLLIVLMMDGWEFSTGVTEEIKLANEIGIKIIYRKIT